MQTRMVSLLYTGTHGRLHGLEQIQKDLWVHGEDMVEVRVSMVRDKQELSILKLLQLQDRQELVLDTELLLLLNNSH